MANSLPERDLNLLRACESLDIRLRTAKLKHPDSDKELPVPFHSILRSLALCMSLQRWNLANVKPIQ
jgi:hypothetical protein